MCRNVNSRMKARKSSLTTANVKRWTSKNRPRKNQCMEPYSQFKLLQNSQTDPFGKSLPPTTRENLSWSPHIFYIGTVNSPELEQTNPATPIFLQGVRSSHRDNKHKTTRRFVRFKTKRRYNIMAEVGCIPSFLCKSSVSLDTCAGPNFLRK